MYRDYTNTPVDFIDEITAGKLIRFVKQQSPAIILPSNLFYLRRRIAIALTGFKISVEDLELKIRENDQEFADQLLYYIFSDHTELFRDADVWTLLLELFKLFAKENKSDIFIPLSVRGEELYSLIILLMENNLINDFKITVDGPSRWALGKILQGEMSHLKIRSSIMNMKSVINNTDISSYTLIKNGLVRFNPDFLKNVYVNNDKKNQFDLIFCRNKTLNMSENDTEIIHSELIKRLKKNGILLLGSGEYLSRKFVSDFKIFSKAENIYQKIK